VVNIEVQYCQLSIMSTICASFTISLFQPKETSVGLDEPLGPVPLCLEAQVFLRSANTVALEEGSEEIGERRPEKLLYDSRSEEYAGKFMRRV
jgi:hypothetical protein